MDYSVGSLADFISGSDTPNKPTVSKQLTTPKLKYQSPLSNGPSPGNNNNSSKKSPNLKKHMKNKSPGNSFQTPNSKKTPAKSAFQTPKSPKGKTPKTTAKPLAVFSQEENNEEQSLHVLKTPKGQTPKTPKNKNKTPKAFVSSELATMKQESNIETTKIKSPKILKNKTPTIKSEANVETNDLKTPKTPKNKNKSPKTFVLSGLEAMNDEPNTKIPKDNLQTVPGSPQNEEQYISISGKTPQKKFNTPKNKTRPFSKSNTPKLNEKDKDDEMDTVQSPTSVASTSSKTPHNAQKRIDKKKTKKLKTPEDKERSLRTVFVGNLSNKIKKNYIKQLFQKYGPVETIRIRCAAPADIRVSKKVAVIKQEFHPDRKNLNAFVRFASEEDAQKALTANGKVINKHHIRVDMAHNVPKPDQKLAVFVGNLPFSVEEDELWELFEQCGDIESVRVVRDKKTGIGKGFGYINFKTIDAVELAINLADCKIGERPIRITRSVNTKTKDKIKDMMLTEAGAANVQENATSKRNPDGSKKRYNVRSQGAAKREKFGNDNPIDETADQNDDSSNSPVKKVNPKLAGGFEGAVADKKKFKKKKANRGDLEKKKMIKRLAPRSKPAAKNLKTTA